MDYDNFRELYEAGDWICIFSIEDKIVEVNSINGADYRFDRYKLIHKNHKDMLNYFLDGCEVWYYDFYGQFDPIWTKLTSLDEYKKEFQYLVIPKTLEECYCDISELHYDKLMLDFDDISFSSYIDRIYCSNNPYFKVSIKQNIIVGTDKIQNLKKIEFNEQIDEWVYCIANSNTKKEIKMDKQVTNNFKDYGFTADFDGEITGVSDEGEFIGFVYMLNNGIHKNGTKAVNIWNKDGKSQYQSPSTDITPIPKEPKYPIFKKNPKGEIFRFDGREGYPVLAKNWSTNSVSIDYHPKEYWSDVEYNSKLELYDGQPYYQYYVEGYNPKVSVQFYDIKSKNKINILEPIPLETLKTMDFIWDTKYSLITRCISY